MINIQDNIAKIVVGNTSIGRVYLGSELVWGGESPALPYDSEVEWLGSDSNAYINTGISGNNYYLRITGHFIYTTHVNYGAIYGNYVSDSSNATRLILAQSSNAAIVNMNTVCNTNGSTQVTCPINTKHFFLSNYNHVIIDSSVTTVSNKKGGTANSGNICLFNRNLTNIVSRNIGLKIYDFQIYDNGVLVRDFIPVRVSQVGYMYDKVSGTLFGNEGTGSFTFGNDVQRELPYDAEIEYLESNGTQQIDTLYVPKGYDNTIETKITYLGYSNTNSWLNWFSAYVNEETDTYRIIRNENLDTQVLVYNGNKPSKGGIKIDVTVGTDYDLKLYPSYLLVNGTMYNFTTLRGNENTNTLHLFGGKGTKIRMWGFKLTKGTTVILDMIPVRKDGVGYMYDKVSGKLFGNVGTGSFTLGPDVS